MLEWMNAFIGWELVCNLVINCCKNIFCRSYPPVVDNIEVFNLTRAQPGRRLFADGDQGLSPVNVRQVLDGDLLLPVGLLHVGLQEMFVVLDGVVSEIIYHVKTHSSSFDVKIF